MNGHRAPGVEARTVLRSQADVLRLALELAARAGDPDPELIQHTIASREAATKTTGSWVASEEPSYLIAIRGSFTTPRPPGPPRLRRPGWENETVSFSVRVLVVELASGRVTDCGGDDRYPDLGSVGPVITDYRDSAPVGGQYWRRLRLRWHRRRVIARAQAIRARQPPPFELRYEGTVTVGSPGRARLRDRGGGLAELFWEAIAGAGWLGRSTGHLEPSIELSIRVPAAPRPAPVIAPDEALRDGGGRELWPSGRKDADGSACQRYFGPLHRRAIAAGFRLVESEARPEDFDDYEDLLYTAAVHAGWLAELDGASARAEIPGVEITIRLPPP